MTKANICAIIVSNFGGDVVIKNSNIDIYSDEFKKLRDRDKLDVVRNNLKYIFNNNGRKNVTVIYKNKKVSIRKEDFGLFKNLVEREKALEKRVLPLYRVLFGSDEYNRMSIKEKEEVIKAKLNYIFESKNDPIYEDDALVGVVYEGSSKLVPSLLLPHTKKLINMLSDLRKEKTSTDHVDNNVVKSKNTLVKASTFESDSSVNVKEESNSSSKTINKKDKKKLFGALLSVSLFSGLFKKMKTCINKSVKFIQNGSKKVWNGVTGLFTKTKNSFNGLRDRIHSNKDNNNSVKSKFIKTYNSVKEKGVNLYNGVINNSDNKKDEYKNNTLVSSNNSRNKRRFASLIGACIILLSLCSIKGCSNSKNNNGKDEISSSQGVDNNNTLPTVPSLDNITNDLPSSNLPSEDNTTDEETVVEDKEDDNTEEVTNDSISFDDVVTIEDNANIYSNCYDATYNTNSLNPYFDGDYERSIEGIVYELDGNIYIVYANDYNALERQKELEDKGAVITSVLVTRTEFANSGQYEGYYSYSNVRVKTR